MVDCNARDVASEYAKTLCERLSDKVNGLSFADKKEVLVAFHAIAMGLYAEGLTKLDLEAQAIMEKKE